MIAAHLFSSRAVGESTTGNGRRRGKGGVPPSSSSSHSAPREKSCWWCSTLLLARLSRLRLSSRARSSKYSLRSFSARNSSRKRPCSSALLRHFDRASFRLRRARDSSLRVLAKSRDKSASCRTAASLRVASSRSARAAAAAAEAASARDLEDERSLSKRCFSFLFSTMIACSLREASLDASTSKSRCFFWCSASAARRRSSPRASASALAASAAREDSNELSSSCFRESRAEVVKRLPNLARSDGRPTRYFLTQFARYIKADVCGNKSHRPLQQIVPRTKRCQAPRKCLLQITPNKRTAFFFLAVRIMPKSGLETGKINQRAVERSRRGPDRRRH